MAEPLPREVLDSAVDPNRIVQQSFDVERRGFDQRQVQQYLRAIAQSLRDAQQREAEMRTRLGRAVRRAETAEQALRESPSHDTAELNREFGEQVSSILEAARVVGDQRVNAAEKSARQLLANAKTEATRLRNEAEGVLDERRAEAEAAAADIVATGKAEADEIRAQGQAEADELIARATAEFEKARAEADEIRAQGQGRADELIARAASALEQARAEGDALINEAEEARSQILEDMERRRRQARAQVERLRVGRDRLLRSYDVVRRTLEETTLELRSSLSEAKVRGDGAARAVLSEEPASREQLEAEIRDAKMIGRIAIPPAERTAPNAPGASGPASASETAAPRSRRQPELRSPALPRPLDPPPRSETDGTETSVPSARSRAEKAESELPSVRKRAEKPEPELPSVRSRAEKAEPELPSVRSRAEKPEPELPSVRKPQGPAPSRRSPVPPQPKAPAVAPNLKATPASDDETSTERQDPTAEMISAAEALQAGTAAPVPAGLDSAPAAEPEAEVADLEDEVVAEAASEDLAAEAGAADLDLEDEIDAELAAELAGLEDPDLDVVEPSDEIEEVVAVSPAADRDDGEVEEAAPEPQPMVEQQKPARTGLFDALRAQRAESAEAQTADAQTADAQPADPRQPADAQTADAQPADPRQPADAELADAPNFDAQQRGDATAMPGAAESGAGPQDAGPIDPQAEEPSAADLQAQRDAVIIDAAKQLERRLKRALADEQNELLAGIRSAAKDTVALTSIVGDIDDHIARYVVAIHEVAAVTYGAGAALIDGRPDAGRLPAGAVEELLATEVVLPIRERLESLDRLEVETADLHLDPVRAFYRQRKTDHLGPAAARLANLLCVAGLCDSLPDGSSPPWTQPATQQLQRA